MLTAAVACAPPQPTPPPSGSSSSTAPAPRSRGRPEARKVRTPSWKLRRVGAVAQRGASDAATPCYRALTLAGFDPLGARRGGVRAPCCHSPRGGRALGAPREAAAPRVCACSWGGPDAPVRARAALAPLPAASRRPRTRGGAATPPQPLLCSALAPVLHSDPRGWGRPPGLTAPPAPRCTGGHGRGRRSRARAVHQGPRP